MYTYDVELFNSKSGESKLRATKQLTFPEAVREAYMIRLSMGLSWEISSVTKRNLEQKLV